MPYNGDFIKRHAEAASIFENITVIYVVKDADGIITKSVHTETEQRNRLTEIIIYYYVPPKRIKIIEKISSVKKYRSLYKEAIRKYIAENGKPDVLHVTMGMQVAPVALWFTRSTGVPYVVTEHWTGFLEEAIEKFSMLPFYLRQSWNKLIRRAAGTSAVSKYLADRLAHYFPKKRTVVIPNVVNKEIFRFIDINEAGKQVFLHVSGLDAFKNPLLILSAFKRFNNENPGSILNIIGSVKKEIIEAAKQMGLEKSVFFYPEMPQKELAGFMQKSDALILYSRYETFGCVIIEANACGIPVIVSDIPVFHETITEGENGVFAGVEDAELLARKMKWVVENKTHFKKAAIANNAILKYGYSAVGKQFSDWYDKILLKGL